MMRLFAHPIEPFDPKNPTHIKIINQRLEEFNIHYKPLRNLDWFQLEIPAGVSVALMLNASCTFFGVIVLSCVAYMGNYFLRTDLENTYQTHLSNLLDVYNWARYSDAGASSSEFLNLEKTIMLYVDKKHLVATKVEKPSWSWNPLTYSQAEKKTEVKIQESPSLQKITGQIGEAVRLWRYGYKTPEDRQKKISEPVKMLTQKFL